MNDSTTARSDAQTLQRAWEGTSDDAIVARVTRGESALFEVLMRRHNQRLFRVARAIVRDADDAEDVMQEAYVQAYTKLHQFEGRSKFSTWLTRIAVHEALARVRKRRPDVDPEAEPVVSAMPNPEDALSSRELGQLLEPLVDALPDAFRAVFVLRAVEGLSATEVAECLAIPEETVRTRFFRARRTLQLQLEQQLMASVRDLYEFHLLRCDRIVAAVFARIPGEPPV
jgi:RNA polymerase sigma-70 factor (ECF subfamily)